jgi:endonuclease-3
MNVLKTLKKLYPNANCSLNFSSPLELLVATILSAQCTDVRVNIVTKSLFAKYKTASDFANETLPELENNIRSTGFYHNKAKSIQGACRRIVETYGGVVPDTMDELTTLPGVGRKTANVVLGTGFGKAVGVVVDTHVSRISQRLGLTESDNPEKIEQDLMKQFPKKSWTELSHLLIMHGRKLCTARNPKCDDCPFKTCNSRTEKIVRNSP